MARAGVYKHGPPDGGRIAVGFGIYKHCPPDGGRIAVGFGVYKHCPPDGGRSPTKVGGIPRLFAQCLRWWDSGKDAATEPQISGGRDRQLPSQDLPAQRV